MSKNETPKDQKQEKLLFTLDNNNSQSQDTIAFQNQEMSRVDKFFEEVGLSKYQVRILLTLILIFLADGIEVMVLNFVIKSISVEWSLNKFEKSLVASSVFIGLFLGSITAGKLLDTYGRKTILVGSCLLVAIFGVVSCFSQNSFLLFISRFLLGLGVGAEIPASTSLCIESISKNLRAHFISNLFFGFFIGEIYICIMGYIFVPVLENGNWRTLLILACLPSFITLFSLYTIYESPRFLLAKERFTMAKDVITSIAVEADLRPSIIDFEKVKDETRSNEANKLESHFSVLFNKEFILLTVTAAFIHFAVAFVYYSTSYVFPQLMQILEQQSALNSTVTPTNVSTPNNSTSIISTPNLQTDPVSFSVDMRATYLSYIQMSFFNMISNLCAGFVADLPSLGRKGSLMVIFLSVGILNGLILFVSTGYTLLLSLSRAIIGMSFQIIKIYVNEAYPTSIRGLGYGTSNSFARFSSILVPFLCEGIIEIFGIYGPFGFILLVCFIAVYVSYRLPFETLGRSLDFIKEEDEIVEERNRSRINSQYQYTNKE